MNPLLQYFGVKAINKLFDRFSRKRKAEDMVKKSDTFEAHDIPPDIILETFCESPEMGTFSKLSMTGFCCYIVELPDRDNKPNISCIPAGIYDLQLAPSKVVKDTTEQAVKNDLIDTVYTHGWHICHVPGRSDILVHIANTIRDLLGCLGPGDKLGCVNGLWAVMNSAKTFDAFMKAMEALPVNNHRIEIRRNKS